MSQYTKDTPGRPEPEAARPPAEEGGGPSKLVLFGLLLGLILGLLDGTIVGTALPTIVGDLGGLDHLSWVVTAYLLTASLSTPIWGKLGDLYGRKGSFIWSVAVFLAGSVLSGLAQDMGQLIAFRALQGLGAGGLMVGAISIIGVMLPPSQAGRSQAMIGAMMPVALVGGPLLGGFLTDQLDWRWVFYVNIPIGALALLVVGLRLHLHTERIKARIDYAGVGLLCTAILALTLVGSWGGTRYAWSSPQIIGLGVTGALALAWFARVEQRAAEPIIPPRLFADRNFTVAQVLTFLVGAAMLGASAYLPQYMQFVRGASSTVSGMLLLPLMAGMFGAQLLLGKLLASGGRFRPYPLIGGALTAGGRARPADDGGNRHPHGGDLRPDPRTGRGHGPVDAEHAARHDQQRDTPRHGRRHRNHHPRPYDRQLTRHRGARRRLHEPPPRVRHAGGRHGLDARGGTRDARGRPGRGGDRACTGC